MKKNILYLFLATSVCMSGCDVKDPIYNTPHSGQGTITLTTDWSQIGEGLGIPASYTVMIGDYTTTVGGTTAALDHFFEPGTYRMLVYNTPENIRIEGTVADATPGQGVYYPGGLFSCAAEVTIAEDTDHAITAVMRQQVRQLTLVVEPTGDAADRIEHIWGSLKPMACKLDLENGTHSVGVRGTFGFSKITEGADAGKWTFTQPILGFIPEETKILEIEIYYRNDSPEKQVVTSDLTEPLAGFNDDKRTPLILSGKVVETPTGAGFGATIKDWITVSGSGTAE